MTKIIFKIAILSLAITMITLTSCKKEDNFCKGYTMATQDALQGTWLHQYPEKNNIESGFGAPTKYKIRFESDSFFLIKNITTDMVGITCELGNYYKYYAGTFKINDEVLYLKGLHIGSDFDPATVDSCYFHPPFDDTYSEEFLIYFCNDELQLENSNLTERPKNTDYWNYIRMRKE